MSEPFKTPTWAEIDWPATIKAMREAGLRMQVALAETLARLETNMAEARRRREEMEPEYRERLSIARYNQRVYTEKCRGYAFVKEEAYRVRKELGLPTAAVLYNNGRAPR